MPRRRKRKKNKRRPSRRRSTAARRRATARTRRSVPKRRRNRRRATARRKPTTRRKRRTTKRRRRNALTKKELASYRRAMGRYGRKSKKARGLLSRLAAKHRRRNADVMAASMKSKQSAAELAKGAGMAMLRGGAGFTSSMLVGHFLGQATGSQYGPLLGNALTVAVSEVAQAKSKKAQLLGHSFTAGAAVAAFYNLMNLLVQRGVLTGRLAQYLAPWSEAAVAPMAIINGGGGVVNGGAGAVVQQAALYGMGANPVEAEMQHRMHMIEQGMSGGIFDSKTTLGEYDILETAPYGTMVQQGLAEYQTYPPSMGATVEQATAGLGATVQEAFAGPGLREYVSVPLQGMRDYVNVGQQPPQYWSQSARGQAILGQIREAARKLTAQRLASGQPVDAAFKTNLKRAAIQAVQGTGKDVSMAAAVPPLTEAAAPFPGQAVMDVGGVYGQPTAVPSVDEAMEEDDAGIFA